MAEVHRGCLQFKTRQAESDRLSGELDTQTTSVCLSMRALNFQPLQGPGWLQSHGAKVGPPLSERMGVMILSPR